MKIRFYKKTGSTRLYIFYFFHGLFRKWLRFHNSFFRYPFLLPDFRKNIKNIDIIVELRKLLPLLSNFQSLISENEKKQILWNAEKILNNRFRVFGKTDIELNPITWLKDIQSGYEWPNGKYYTDYIQVDLTNNADVKYPRELSRSHFLLYLGEAYLLTNNEQYVQKLIEIIKDWLIVNPFMHSINWGCAMDVSIRAVNWAYAFAMVLDSKNITEKFKKDFTISLYQHAWFIYKNQERNYYNNANHYDSNIAALLFFGILFNKTIEGNKWYTHAKEEFYFEVRQQIMPSGVIYEKSINYGRLVAEMFTFCYCLLRIQNEDIPQDIHYRIEKQFEFIANYIKPDGLAPVIGDQDDARWLPFSPVDNRDHKHLLSLAAILFNRADFKALSNGYSSDVFFIIKDKTKTDFLSIHNFNITLSSIAFKDAGFFIMKTSNLHLFINNSGMGKYHDLPFSPGSHTHADLLSFELAFNQRTFLVDPGTYVYTSNPYERNRFRSTAMHNTICIDGKDQMIITDDLFAFNSPIHPKLLQWISNSVFDLFEGEHDGYIRLTDPVIHRRNVFLEKKNQEIIITDRLIGKENHDVEIYFHFDAGVDFEFYGDKKIKTCFDNESNLVMSFEQNMVFSMEKIDDWVSKKYGHRESSKTLKVRLSSVKLPLALTTIIRFE